MLQSTEGERMGVGLEEVYLAKGKNGSLLKLDVVNGEEKSKHCKIGEFVATSIAYGPLFANTT